MYYMKKEKKLREITGEKINSTQNNGYLRVMNRSDDVKNEYSFRKYK